MGQLRLVVPSSEMLPAAAVERSYMAGLDGVPWRTDCWREGQQLVVARAIGESGNLFVPWQVSGHGELVLSTATLMERDEPYHLATELARGTLYRVRSQAAELELAGLRLSDELREGLRNALTQFALAATDTDPVVADAHAARALELACDAIERLSGEQAAVLLERRHLQAERLPTLFAGGLGKNGLPAGCNDLFSAAFNAASVPFVWRDLQPEAATWCWETTDRQIDWCQKQGLRICGGPLMRLDDRTVPAWSRSQNYASFEERVLEYVAETVQRYAHAVHVWHATAGFNHQYHGRLGEEETLRLAVMIIETVRRIAPRAPVVVSFDQPWAEYLAKTSLELSPLHFADALIRADSGIAGVGLEINHSFWPGGTMPRDWLEIGRHTDRWSLLGLPLLVFLGAPSAPAAADAEAADYPTWNAATPQEQARFVERLVPMLLAKPAVQAVIWSHASDSDAHPFPHTGFFPAAGPPKPALEAWTAIRRQHVI